MKEIKMKAGMVVVATAGRDQGKFFVITEVADENYVRIANGATRSLEKPKLKKIKHIKPTKFELPEFKSGEKLRRALKELEESK